MPDPDDIAAIVKGLTEAQRDFLLRLPADGAWMRTTKQDLARHGPNALCGFGKLGFTEGYYRECMRHRLTPLGVRARAALQEDRPC